MLQSSQDDFTVTITQPLEKCQQYFLSTSSTSVCLLDKTTNNKTVLFNTNDITKICPRDKNYNTCMDYNTSKSTFQQLAKDQRISDGGCGSLEVLSTTLGFCTPGMEIITNEYSDQILADKIKSACKFPLPDHPRPPFPQ